MGGGGRKKGGGGGGGGAGGIYFSVNYIYQATCLANPAWR